VVARLVRRGERWLVHDVVVGGVSLVGNYRAQFDRIIRTSSYDDLVKRLRTRGDLLRASDPRLNRISR
jgi:phospholipid transport system substrate-binding protein